MDLLRLFVRSSARALALAVILGACAGVAGMGLISQVNRALSQSPTSNVAWLFAALCLLRVLLGFLAQIELHALSQGSIYKLRMQLSDSILLSPLSKLEAMGPGKLFGVLSQDIVVLAQGGLALTGIITQLTFVVACAIYLGWLSPMALASVLVVFAAGLGVQRLLDRRSDTMFTLARKDRDDMFAGFRGITEGSKELKLHAGRSAAFLAESIEGPADAYRRKHVLGGGLLIAARNWFSILFFLLVGLLLFALPSVRTISSRVLVSSVLTILYMQSAIEGLLLWLPDMGVANAALRNIQSLGLSLMERSEAPDGPSIPKCKRIELRNVVHRFKSEDGDEMFTLGPIELVLEAGEIVFLTGGNGSGKSTLVKVLTGLYAPEGGDIQVDGETITEATRGGYRQLFSAVFSDWYLFDRLFGIDAASVEADAARYLTELRLDKKVSVRDGSLSTTALSQGQRKRLMLLTAYLEDRPVYVFDEWASDQDPVFKEVFYTQILKRLKDRGKFVVVVSHDDHYFHVADRVVRLEAGKLAKNLSS